MSKELEMLREMAKLQADEIAHGRTFPGHRNELIGPGEKMLGTVDFAAILARLEAAERVCEGCAEHDVTDDYGVFKRCPVCGGTSAYDDFDRELFVPHKPGCPLAAYRALDKETK